MKMMICMVVPRECSVLSSDVEEKGWPDFHIVIVWENKILNIFIFCYRL